MLRVSVASKPTSLPIRNQLDILMTSVANVRKGQTDMPYKGELQTIIKQSMRHPRLS